MSKNKSTKFMTSTEKKIYRKNKAIKTLCFLLFLSVLVNVVFTYYFYTNRNQNDAEVIGKETVNDKEVSSSNDSIIDDNNEEQENRDSDIKRGEEGINESEPSSWTRNDKNGNNDYLIKTKEDCYDVIYKQLVEGKDEIILCYEPSNILIDDTHDCYKKIIEDHPELFWLNGGTTGGQGVYDNGLVKYNIGLTTRIDVANIEEMKSKLDSVVEEIVNKAKGYESDYEKALYVHDYLVKECEYDYNNYILGETKGEEYVNQLVYTAYGCLVDKNCVCAGYANAYSLIMKELGIECGVISGVGYNSLGVGGHAWNYINLDEEYYLVDVTWDDPIHEGDYVSEEISHKYFCITSEKMNEDHKPDSDQFVPEAVSDKYMN